MRAALNAFYAAFNQSFSYLINHHKGQGRPLPVDDQGGPARLDDLHTWGLLRDDAYVGVLSDHDVSVLIPGLSI